MNKNAKRTMIGTIILTIGLLGLIASTTSLTTWGQLFWPNSAWPMMNNMMPMMGQWNQGPLDELNGLVEKIGQMEIELEADGTKVEIHGPQWFWQEIGMKEGDAVAAKGVFVSMMTPNEGRHEELIPFELAINGKNYGNVSTRMPVWMQR